MSPIAPTVTRVTDPRALDAALALPHRLHGDDPCWVAPIGALVRRRTRQFLDRGDLTLLAAERDGQVVGTISVLRDKGFEEDKGERVAWFGYFETEDDPAIVDALFAAAAEVARGFGATHLRGPRDLTRYENVGMTVEGFDVLPPFLAGHHPRHYPKLVEGAGFGAHHDILAYDIPVRDELGNVADLPPQLREKAATVDIPDLEIRPASRRHLTRDLVLAHEVVNVAWRTVPDVAPLPRAAFVNVGRPYLMVADPKLLQIALTAGRPIGFAACFPELNEALAGLRGPMFPVNWARALARLRQVKTASFKLIGVLPEFRGTGLHARLIANVVDAVRDAGYHRVEASVIDERNAPMRAVVEHVGMKVYRRWRFFEREIA